MKEALRLAELGKGNVSPNPMVGAVVVSDGEIVGRGYHEIFGGNHAEVNAIDNAGNKAEGAVLYVTLEPCNHTGKTPPCTKKILEAGIKKVVVAMDDPNPHVKGGGNRHLMENGVEVVTGVMENEACRLNEAFVKHIRTGKPFVILKCASTLDGRIATRTGDSRWVTNDASRAHVHEIRHAVDAIMVGRGTVSADDPSLTTRLPGGNGKDPLRIITDTKLSLPQKARIFHLDSAADTLIVAGKPFVTEEKKQAFENTHRKNVRLIEAPTVEDFIDLDALMGILGKKGIQSLLIEGGSRMIHSALNAGIVDKVMFFIAPKLLTGDDGHPISRGPGPEKMADALELKNIEIKRFNDDILIEGYTR